MVKTTELNVRDGPGTDYRKVASVTEGQRLTVLGKDDGSAWLNIRLADGTKGWVSPDYVAYQGPSDTKQQQSTPDPTVSTPRPLPAVAAAPAATENSIEYKLASINRGFKVPANDPTVIRFASLLDSLDNKSVESRQEVADMLVKGWDLLNTRDGIRVGLLELTEATDEAIPVGTPPISFAEVLAALMTIMRRG